MHLCLDTRVRRCSRVHARVPMLGCAHAHAQVFLPILDLLHAPKASISMLVFKLPYLQNAVQRDKCLAQLRIQLDSFAVHASAAPGETNLLLVGTHKRSVVGTGDEAAASGVLRQLSATLWASLKSSFAALPKGSVVFNGELCFFPIENSVGFEGDATLRELVAAVEARAKALPSMQQRVPSGWLAVYDHLARELAKGQQLLSLPKVTAIAQQCGLPHRGGGAVLTLEREVELMLSYLHALGAVCWFDLPRLAGLRELVILDPQACTRAMLMPMCMRKNVRPRPAGEGGGGCARVVVLVAICLWVRGWVPPVAHRRYGCARARHAHSPAHLALHLWPSACACTWSCHVGPVLAVDHRRRLARDPQLWRPPVRRQGRAVGRRRPRGTGG